MYISTGARGITDHERRAALLLFRGKNANAALEHHREFPISEERLANILETDDTPYVGHVPTQLAGNVKLSESEIFEALDTFAQLVKSGASRDGDALVRILTMLRSEEPKKQGKWALFKQWMKNRFAGGMKKSIQLVRLGAGLYGQVFKIKLGRQAYALKVFFCPRGRDAPYGEAAVGHFFSQRQTRNMSRFYAANPEECWMLMEYISHRTRLVDRQGLSMQEQGFAIGDDHRGNSINGIRVDYGGNVYKCSTTKS